MTDYMVMEDLVVGYLGLAKPAFVDGYLTLLALDMFPIIFIQLVCGTYIYKHFFMATAYYFTRQGNKSIWFLKEAKRLFFFILSIVTLYICGSTLMMLIVGVKLDDLVNVILLDFFIIILFTLYTYIYSLIINLVSIFAGSQNGFVLVYSIQMFFVFILLIHEKIGCSEGIGGFLFKINPISNLIISFHSTKAGFDKNINMLNMNFELGYSVIYFLVMAFAVICASMYILKNIDLSIQNREEIG
jgi:hypothetical protein